MNLKFVLLSYFPTFLLSFVLSMGIFHPLTAQTVLPCGTPNNSLSAVSAITSQLPFPTVASGIEVRVPIWFYHVRETNGTPVVNNLDANALVNSINLYFNGIFEFVLCGTTNIDNSTWSDLSFSLGEQQALNNNASTVPGSEYCVKVFLCHTLVTSPLFTTAGFAAPPTISSPGAVYITGTSDRTFAHEMGHYFGLLHTHDNQPQYVNDFGESNCFNSGDGICDTPADPESSVNGCLADSDCMGYSCNITDPAGVAYMPDITNLMSYYPFNCRNKFSPQQKVVMRAFYNQNPSYAFLRAALPDCIKTPYGIVERDCSDDPLDPDASPLVNLSVYLTHHNAITPCEVVTNDFGRFFWGGCNQPSTINKIEAEDEHTPHLNGVSSVDLSFISSHILGVKPFTNPYKLIAADANFSGTVTTFDVVELRKLILSIYDELPNNVSWRYVPKEYLDDQGFSNNFITNLNPFAAKITVSDPFSTPVTTELTYKGVNSYFGPKTVNLNTQSGSSLQAWSLWAVKIGDVNCSAALDAYSAEVSEETFGSYQFGSTGIPQNGLRTVQIIATSPKPVRAWQIGTTFSKEQLHITEIKSNSAVLTQTSTENCHFDNKENTTATNGYFNALWYSETEETKLLSNSIITEFGVEGIQNIGQLQNVLKISTSKIPTAFYDANGEVIDGVELSLRVLNEIEGRSKQSALANTSIRVYPNLITDKINFVFDGATEQEVKVSVFNSRGNLVAYNETLLQFDNQKIVINDIENLLPGVYWYSVSLDNQIKQGKLIKQ